MIFPSPSAFPLTGLPFATGLLDYIEPFKFTYSWAGIACFVGLIIYTWTRPKDPYYLIPAVGRTHFFGSYIDAIRFFTHGQDMIAEGYKNHRDGIFRVPELSRWHVVVADGQLIEELRKAPDDTLSFEASANNDLALRWTVGPAVADSHYHAPIVRSQLTRHLGRIFNDLHDEITLAFNEYVPLTQDWVPIKGLDTVMKVVSRASNRAFIGAPTCRNPEYMKITVKFAVDVVIGSQFIGLFPNFLKPFAGRFLTSQRAIKSAAKHIKPLYDERRRNIEEYGKDYPNKPLDMLTWLMDEATGVEATLENLTRRVLLINVAAIHTTSMTFTHAFFELARRPEYVAPLREEIEAAVAEYGWTKLAMTNMRKLDSFMKETQRWRNLFGVIMGRLALKDFTFSNGVRVPKGATLAACSMPRHLDESLYPNADVFNGFRFSDIRASGEEEGTKNQMSATSTTYLPFGHGKHACPGRFFASNELKLMMAHILVTYDLKMSSAPEMKWFGFTSFPDPKAEVSFRKRRT